VDLFDCVFPTSLARNGTLLTKQGRFDIYKKENKDKFEPIESDCKCYTCTNYTKAYLNHLLRAKEILGHRLATIHNVYFLVHVVGDIRESILGGRFIDYKKEFLANYKN